MPQFLHGFAPQLLEGALLTLLVTFTSLIMGSVFGVLGAVSRMHQRLTIRAIANTYVFVIRGIPDLLVLFIVFYGSTITLTAIAGRYVELSAFWSGAFALSVVFGAYATEIFRGAIQSIPAGQGEAARALGLSATVTFLKVVLPQAWRLALPAYGNQVLVLMKQTSLISIVGLEELVRKGRIAVGATNEPFTFYAAVGLIFLVMTMSTTFLLKRAERAANAKYERA